MLRYEKLFGIKNMSQLIFLLVITTTFFQLIFTTWVFVITLMKK